MKRPKPALVLSLAVIFSSALNYYINTVDELNQVSGGSAVSLGVCMAVLFSPFLHLKDLLLTDHMEGYLMSIVAPYLQPSTDDDEHFAMLVDVPDYSNEPLAWNSLPHVDGTSSIVPPHCGADGPCEAENQANARADLFFVGPSSHYSFKWNANWRDDMTRYMNREAIVIQQAATLNHVAKIYFPQIRQMSGLGYLSPNATEATRASEIAYSDVKRAFEYYLEHYNNGRPIFLAGHSQGSEYVLRLLKEVIAPNAQLKSKLIVAYLVGMPVYEHVLEEIGVPPCLHAKQTGCVVSWQTYIEGADPKHFYFEPIHAPLRYSNAAAAAAKKDKFASRVCVNPLSWTASNETYVDRSHNRGAMHLVQLLQNVRFLLSYGDKRPFRERQKERLAALLGLAPNLVGARCVNGSLYVDSPPLGELGSNPFYSFFPVWRFAMFPGSNLHPSDYNLFWGNIRANAAERVNSYFAQQQHD